MATKKRAFPPTVPTTLPEGRKFIVVAPFCWGKGATPQEAERNALKNRVRIYEGARGWRFVLFDAPADGFIDGMGCTCYTPRPDGATEESAPFRELYRFNMEKEG